MPINIGLDLRGLDPSFKAHFGRGTGRYAAELASALDELVEEDPSLRRKDDICTSSILLDDLKHAAGLLSKVATLSPFGRATLETQCFLPRTIERISAKRNLRAVHFFSHGDAPAYPKVKQIVTVLDLIPLRFPELYKPDRMTWRFRLARYLELRAVKAAAGILTISQASKRDIVDLLKINPEKVIVTHLGVSKEFKPRTRRGEIISERHGVSKDTPVLLYVGGIDPRKNALFLLRVLRELIDARESLGISEMNLPKLVMVGRYENDHEYPNLLNEIKRLKLKEHVILTGFVSDIDLPRYYQASDVLVFPSLYEGFGLPVLEAMSSGLAVVAGRNSSLPEVVGESGLLVPDNDTASWVKAISGLLVDSNYRSVLGSKGIERAKEFTWERAAVQTLEAYRYFLKEVN